MSVYAALIHRVPAILYEADPGADGAFHYVSPQIEAVLGFSVEEWIANPRLWAARLHPDDRDDVLGSEWTRAVQGHPDPVAVEYRMLHRDGHTVWLRDDAHLLRDEDGELRWHGVLSDVSDRKRAEVELERRAAQQAAVARLGEHALQRVPIEALIEEAVLGAAELIGTESATVGEIVADGQALKLRAAHGWARDDVGQVRLLSACGSQAGYTLARAAPVVVEDWASV
jgi:PAS domain S-box-containing protein